MPSSTFQDITWTSGTGTSLDVGLPGTVDAGDRLIMLVVNAADEDPSPFTRLALFLDPPEPSGYGLLADGSEGGTQVTVNRVSGSGDMLAAVVRYSGPAVESGGPAVGYGANTGSPLTHIVDPGDLGSVVENLYYGTSDLNAESAGPTNLHVDITADQGEKRGEQRFNDLYLAVFDVLGATGVVPPITFTDTADSGTRIFRLTGYVDTFVPADTPGTATIQPQTRKVQARELPYSITSKMLDQTSKDRAIQGNFDHLMGVVRNIAQKHNLSVDDIHGMADVLSGTNDRTSDVQLGDLSE